MFRFLRKLFDVKIDDDNYYKTIFEIKKNHINFK